MPAFGKLESTNLAQTLERLFAVNSGDKEKRQLLHELQVYQIELEMQNRELRETQAHLEEARDRYAELYDFAPVGYVSFNRHGVIEQINLQGAALLGRERTRVIGHPLAGFVPAEEK